MRRAAAIGVVGVPPALRLTAGPLGEAVSIESVAGGHGAVAALLRASAAMLGVASAFEPVQEFVLLLETEVIVRAWESLGRAELSRQGIALV